MSKYRVHDLPPKERTLIPPDGGWKPQTYYVVEVAFRITNPIHRAIFFCGFLHDGNPGGYNAAFNPSWEENHCFNEFHYLKVVREIPDVEES